MNGISIEVEKSKIRETVLNQLKIQPLSERSRKNEKILNQISQLNSFQKSKVIMFYVAMNEEVDTVPLLKKVLQENRTVTVPFVDKKNSSLLSVQILDPQKDLAPGSYGILEPKEHLIKPFDLKRLDLVLVPGIAFDRKGRRLGRGKGYYDRFLKSLPPHVETIGLAYDFQLMETIPVNDLDIAVSRVISNIPSPSLEGEG